MNCANLVSFLLFALICFPSEAGPGRDAFDQYVSGFATLKANFIQIVHGDGDPEILEGKVYFSRPDQFRWDYSLPYRQSIISNGEELWIYEQDLDQVTHGTVNNSPENTPMLLLGSSENVALYFDLEELGRHSEFDWLSLAPKQSESQYDDIRLGFDAEGLRIMELQDKLGQTTRMQFSEEERDPVLPSGLFEFKPPPGVDVVEAFFGE